MTELMQRLAAVLASPKGQAMIEEGAVYGERTLSRAVWTRGRAAGPGPAGQARHKHQGPPKRLGRLAGIMLSEQPNYEMVGPSK
jgi:hypothetical protein